MPRRRRCRRIGFQPSFTSFAPTGVGTPAPDVIILTVDEYEAVRLKDFEGLDQRECAARMEISQPTFHRLIVSARRKVADALTHGKAIRIEGGHFRL
ncbi:MAG: DUF134 domain-containing protein [Methanospirillum sp.]|nr:DUF134 domain-containing protein [Methanospirillum sp.]